MEPVDDNGLGSLADELGDAWAQDDGDHGSSFLDGLREGSVDGSILGNNMQSPYSDMNDMYDFGFGMSVQSPLPTRSENLPPLQLSPKKTHMDRASRHQRHESAYDGSDYGPESDTEEQDSMPPLLAKRIRDIEALARTGVDDEDALSEEGGVVRRTTKALKDLGAQSNIENGVTRLLTAYTSMTTHRTHKTRELFSQTHSLLYSGIVDLPEEVIDLLLIELQTLTSTVPFLPRQNPLLSLQILASQTSELGNTLRSLTDVLQESKISANAATRKLKSVKDMTEEMRREEELVDTSIMLIQAGDWDRRCRERHAARTCREIVEGFAQKWDLPYEAEVDAVSAAEIGVAY